MSASNVIFVVLLVLFAATLPIWKYSRIWGSGYKMSLIVGFILAAHSYAVMFADK